ncbi:hypothetical protein CYY_007240 [Polysphondylium violaceum]|uniref:FZ domain-containing protein n=1 Tax=Polysphondylium violaceum TaxID=133409 RepID=A0A8J4PPH5_9MYCE|nr:hypothetical protein CYY_007240 [Polysphondylium violaceum]
MFKLFVATLLLVAVVAAQQPPYPQLPTTFTADVSISSSGISADGKFYYDYSAQMERIDSKSPFFGQVTTTLSTYTNMRRYDYADGNCQCGDLTAPQGLYTVLPGSTYQGQQNINGVDVDMWEFNMGQAVITLGVDPSAVVLVRANMTVQTQFQPVETIMDFSNVQKNAIAASTFAVPSYCQCPTPAPPTPPSPTACPNNPPSGCQCVSGLKFCSAVTYPIASATDANMIDGMIGDMFTNWMQSVGGTTPTCQNNMKSFLCATLFPVCTGQVEAILPCPNLCPTCSCGGDTASCAAALNSTSVCTQYGSGFC